MKSTDVRHGVRRGPACVKSIFPPSRGKENRPVALGRTAEAASPERITGPPLGARSVGSRPQPAPQDSSVRVPAAEPRSSFGVAGRPNTHFVGGPQLPVVIGQGAKGRHGAGTTWSRPALTSDSRAPRMGSFCARRSRTTMDRGFFGELGGRAHMLERSRFPLRRIVGPPIPAREMLWLDALTSPACSDEGITLIAPRRRNNLAETVQDPIYERFLCSHLPGTGDVLLPDSAELPLPPLPPFNSGDPLYSLFALSKEVQDSANGPKLTVTLGILLNLDDYEHQPLVGGIVYGGYPHAPYLLDSDGVSSSNFGLPREVRLSTADSLLAPPRYMDDEVSVTRQETAAHSGFHVLHIDPTATRALYLRLTDFPRFLVRADSASDGPNGQAALERRFFGLCIPYLYVFEYKEGTRYSPTVPAGLHGVTPLRNPRRLYSPGAPPTPMKGDFEAEYEHPISAAAGGSKAIVFSSGSMFGQARKYRRSESIQSARAKRYIECYVPEAMAPGEGVVIMVEQAEEFSRCIAGIRMQLRLSDDGLSEAFRQQIANQFALPKLVYCNAVTIRVYGVDPPTGTPPMLEQLGGRYTTLLFQRSVKGGVPVVDLGISGLRFITPSSSRYFAVEIQNTGDRTGVFAVKDFELCQSAHVWVASRPSRAQHVTAMHFRLTGRELASDYARIGATGLTLAVERWVAGERKSVLHKATSLVDLLHSGIARVHANARRRAVEIERSELVGKADDNYEVRHTHAEGWRRSETGYGVDDSDAARAAQAPGRFESFTNSETRTHTEVLSPQLTGNNRWKATAVMGNVMDAVFHVGTAARREFEDGGRDAFLGEDQHLIPTYSTNRLHRSFGRFWRGIVSTTDGELPRPTSLRVLGMTSVTSSPFGLQNVGASFFDFLDALYSADLTRALTSAADAAVAVAAMASVPGRLAGPMANSFSVGTSISPFGIGVTFSASTGGGLLIPSFVYTDAFGNQGSITRQASRTGYAYGQHLTGSFDDTKSSAIEGRATRRVARSEDVDAPRERLRGAEVMWQGEILDVVTGTIPINLFLPASAADEFHNIDDALRVRLSGVGPELTFDVWFDIVEEVVRDDH